MNYQNTCKTCGKQFESDEAIDYCSTKCSDKAKLEFVNCKIPKRYIDIITDRKDILDMTGSLYLYGNVGTGKTVCAWSVYRRKMMHDIKCMLVNFPAFVNKIRRLYRDGDPYGYADMLMEHTGTLIIDDLGAEKDTPLVIDLLYLIINYRYENMLETIITSNVPIESLNKRIASRLTEMCKVVKFSGKDRRL